MDLASKLKRLCEAKGFTNVADLARKVKVPKSSLHRWFHGEAWPRLAEGLRLARVLEVPLDYLADDEMEEVPAPARDGLDGDERFLVQMIRDLRLTRAEAVRRLACEATGKGPATTVAAHDEDEAARRAKEEKRRLGFERQEPLPEGREI
jgi:transcriptional regulator with XRE-family HTH domain